MIRNLVILLSSTLILSCSTLTNNSILDTQNKINNISKLKISSSKKLVTDKPTLSNKKIFDILKEYSKGLYLTSESDVEFEVFVWNSFGNVTPEKILKKIKQNPKLKIVKRAEGINWLKDYSTDEYWLEGGYSREEARKLALAYKKLIDSMTSNLKDIELYLVDDPNNLPYYPNDGDLSGEVGFYLLGKHGNDVIGLYSYLVWT
jgi:hypothetical protein